MTPQEIAEVRPRLAAFAAQMLGVLPRKDQRAAGGLYARGLLTDGQRESMQPMAARLGGDHQRVQQFITSSTWDYAAVGRDGGRGFGGSPPGGGGGGGGNRRSQGGGRGPGGGPAGRGGPGGGCPPRWFTGKTPPSGGNGKPGAGSWGAGPGAPPGPSGGAPRRGPRAWGGALARPQSPPTPAPPVNLRQLAIA